MKKVLISTACLLMLCTTFFLSGCGGGGGSETKNYFLRFNWINSGPAAILYGEDKKSGKNTELVSVGAGSVNTRNVLSGTITSGSTTDIKVVVRKSFGEVGTAIDVNGVHIAEGKMTVVEVYYNGTTLRVDATGDPEPFDP